MIVLYGLDLVKPIKKNAPDGLFVRDSIFSAKVLVLPILNDKLGFLLCLNTLKMTTWNHTDSIRYIERFIF